MKRLGIVAILALSGFAFSGVASADKSYISFMQAAAAGTSTLGTQSITSVPGGIAYEIVGNVNASLTWVGLCVEVGTAGGYRCQQVLTDGNGEFTVSSSIDSCNFEYSTDFVNCDT